MAQRSVTNNLNKWEGRYGAEALISRPNFHSCSIFDENLVAVQLNRTTINIRKPIYIGLAVLELSKICLFRFHYDFMKKHLGESCNLCYTDTDILMYLIKKHDIYDLMKCHIEEFDTSDYSEQNRFNIPAVNKKIPGTMRDECHGNIMTHFIGLRSKCTVQKLRVKNQSKR